MIDKIKAAVPDLSSFARLDFKKKFLENNELNIFKAQCPLYQIYLPQFPG